MPKLIYIIESEDDNDFHESVILVGCELDSHEARNLFEEMRVSIETSELPLDLPELVEIRHTDAEGVGEALIRESVRIERK